MWLCEDVKIGEGEKGRKIDTGGSEHVMLFMAMTFLYLSHNQRYQYINTAIYPAFSLIHCIVAGRTD